MHKFVVEGGHPLNGTVTPSGNKNEALPVLMACLLTEESVTIKNMPKIRDVLTVCEILKKLGATVEWTSDDTVVVEAKNLTSHKPDPELCSKIRASMMLLGPLLARLGKIELAMPGGDVIGARRIDTHWEGLCALGAELKLENGITGKLDKGVGTELYLDEPSVTATENLIILASACEGVTTIYNAACEPHVVGLCRLLEGMGATIDGVGSNRLTINGRQKLTGTTHQIGPDFMEVGSFLCLGAITEGTITIANVDQEAMRFPLKVFSKIGIQPQILDNSIIVSGGPSQLEMSSDITGRNASIYSGPWPAFPSDLMSVAILAATQSKGTMIFFEKMYEGRMFFTDKLLSMGANIVLCDPHRVVITGPSPLYATHMSSPDVRAGMTLLMAALIAKGTSIIDNIYQIERGYAGIDKKLESLGAAIKRVDQ